ncbi:MAG: primosomal protein N' [Clostridia bacterium]|nr:primosomal protein N' [Clostridia bacterium]
MKIANIIIDGKTRQVDKGFSYRIPEKLENIARVGVRVRVPFGAGDRHEIGYVIKVEEKETGGKIKDIAAVLDDAPLFDREKLVEAYWIKNRYFSTFADAIKLFLPPGSGARLTEWVRLTEKGHKSLENIESKVADILAENGGICAFDVLKEQLGEKTRAIVNSLLKKGAVEITHTTEKKTQVRRMRVLRFCGRPQKKLSEAGERAVRIMEESGLLSMADLCLFASCSTSTVRTLIKNGVLEAEEVEVSRSPYRNENTKDVLPVALNERQGEVAQAIENHPEKPFCPMLLHGVTGSGKTEVYLEAIQKVVENGKSAIVLVPEIALTHQMVGRFLSRFGRKTAVLHSGLSIGERHDEWLRIFRGEARVVVGARSAVFAPCQNLGLIIMDEEHEDTYKSETGVRYHAREVAMCRAKTEGAKLLLASATPSVESYYHAQNGTYRLLELKERYNDAPLPKSIIVDMREEMHGGNTSMVSRTLGAELEKNLQNGEQSILFLNRRGYATYVNCRSCGHVEECPHCSITLTYHSFSDTLNCHWCGYRKRNVTKCPECGSSHMAAFGAGTQKIEELTEDLFPDASVIRMDVDTTRKKEAHEKILARFRDENIDVLLGTQMIAKGLDFPNVTLVGVLNADQILNMGDYKAAERTFSLITQVSGRAGRGEKTGRTVIQTHTPESPVILAASRHDYRAFYDEEIILRKALNYPPFCDIINIIVSGRDEGEVRRSAEKIHDAAQNAFGNAVRLYRAAPCGILKINNAYRWHVWMKCRLTSEVAAKIRTIIENEKKLSVIADVNPSVF